MRHPQKHFYVYEYFVLKFHKFSNPCQSQVETEHQARLSFEAQISGQTHFCKINKFNEKEFSYTIFLFETTKKRKAEC